MRVVTARSPPSRKRTGETLPPSMGKGWAAGWLGWQVQGGERDKGERPGKGGVCPPGEGSEAQFPKNPKSGKRTSSIRMLQKPTFWCWPQYFLKLVKITRNPWDLWNAEFVKCYKIQKQKLLHSLISWPAPQAGECQAPHQASCVHTSTKLEYIVARFVPHSAPHQLSCTGDEELPVLPDTVLSPRIETHNNFYSRSS